VSVRAGDDLVAMSHLPDPTELGLPRFPDCVVAVRVPSTGLTVFRLVYNVPAMETDFLPRPVARGNREPPVLLTVAVSAFLSPESALEVRRHSTSRIAQLQLRPDARIHVARTSRQAQDDHVSIWAPTVHLIRAITRYR
jgi:hypothetical protein